MIGGTEPMRSIYGLRFTFYYQFRYEQSSKPATTILFGVDGRLLIRRNGRLNLGPVIVTVSVPACYLTLLLLYGLVSELKQSTE
jgi:hypothetical protein